MVLPSAMGSLGEVCGYVTHPQRFSWAAAWVQQALFMRERETYRSSPCTLAAVDLG